MKGHKKQSINIHVCIFFVGCILLGSMLGLSIVDAFGKKLEWWQLLGRLLQGGVLFLMAFFVQVILHELGHMLAGMARGWTFLSFMFLGLVLSKREGHFHLSRFAIPGVGGQCLMLPPRKGDTDWGIAFYNAGGILMNLFVAVGSLLVLLKFYHDLPWGVDVFGASLIFSGIFFAATNGIPASQGGIPNDGKNIEQLRKDPFSTNVFLTTMRVMGKLHQGCSVDKAMDGYLSRDKKLDYTNPIHVMAVNFDLSLAVARFDFETAFSILDSMKGEEQKIDSLYQKEILLEKVFLYLVAPRDGVDVGGLIDLDTLKYFEMQTAFRPTALRVKYAFARLYECDEEKAAVIYRQFQKSCDSYHVQGEVISEKKLIEYVRTLEPAEV